MHFYDYYTILLFWNYRSNASVEVFRVFSANNEQKAAFKNKDSAIQQAKSIKGYNDGPG